MPSVSLRFLSARVGQAVAVTWVAYTAAFFLLFALPSDPISLLLGPDAVDVSAQERAELAAQYGFDRPLYEQYAGSLAGLLRGDLGYSIQLGAPVAAVLSKALAATLPLAALGLVFALGIGIGLAVAAVLSTNPALRQFLLGLPSLAVSIPAFWFGLVLIQIFSFRLGLFPIFAHDGLRSLVLPALTLALPTSAMIAQVFARTLNSAFHEAYAVTAFAKGAPRRIVVIRHAARNALLPTLTIAGLVVGQLLAGTVVTETVFSRPGLGRVIVSAVSTQDIPVVLGAVLIGAVVYSGTNLLVDLLYPVLDPRQRRAAPARGPRRTGLYPAPAFHSRKVKADDNLSDYAI